ncbi:MAG: cytochrome P450 [Burkholderiaceae bacterium]
MRLPPGQYRVFEIGRMHMSTLYQTADAEHTALSVPLAEIDTSHPELFRNDTIGRYFARLRKEAPVHYRKSGYSGDFWSVTRYQDIVHVDTNHKIFSSETHTGITLNDRPEHLDRPAFITMDPPRHDEQRKAVSPIVAPQNLVQLQEGIRARTADLIGRLPLDEPFDWVPVVSVELTTRMLATLMDFPFEDRARLTWWSDVAHMDINSGGPIKSEQQRDDELSKMLEVFTRLWEERAARPMKPDLISMMAHADATRHLPDSPREFLGNLQLLIVGGNDTTRNTMSASVYFMDRHPLEQAKLRSNPRLITSMVPEVIRYQTPLAHMKRVATMDTVLQGQRIREGDRVIMWYLSGNRDDEAIENPDAFIIDRARPRQHLSFGFGIHRCVGNRLAELQLNILWDELIKRGIQVEVLEEPARTYSNIIHGFTSMKVRLKQWAGH